MKTIFQWAVDLLFGCRHASLSRPFTIQGRTYEVCLDCGTQFAYSLEAMARAPHSGATARSTMARARSRIPGLNRNLVG